MSTVIAFKPKTKTTPNIQKRKVTPRRRHNKELRQREYLTPSEIARLLKAAGKLGRHGHRDETLLLLAYRHGLRVSELAALRWDQVDLKAALLHVSRLKNGIASVHPLRGPELRKLRRVQREYDSRAYVFVTERGGPMTPDGIRKVIQRAGEEASIVTRK